MTHSEATHADDRARLLRAMFLQVGERNPIEVEFLFDQPPITDALETSVTWAERLGYIRRPTLDPYFELTHAGWGHALESLTEAEAAEHLARWNRTVAALKDLVKGRQPAEDTLSAVAERANVPPDWLECAIRSGWLESARGYERNYAVELDAMYVMVPGDFGCPT